MLNRWKESWKKEDGSEVVTESIDQSSSQEIIDHMDTNIRHSSTSGDVHGEDDRPNKRRKMEEIPFIESSGPGHNISKTLPEIMEVDQSEPSRTVNPMETQPAKLETIVAAAKQNNSRPLS